MSNVLQVEAEEVLTPAEKSVGEALRALAAEYKAKPPQRPKLFPPQAGTPLDPFARVDNVNKIIVRVTHPEETIYEPRTLLDQRLGLDVTIEGNTYDWMRDNAGEATLPGIYLRDARLIRCPRIGEDGYIPFTGPVGDDGPAQVRVLSPEDFAGILQSQFWVYKEKVEVEKDDNGRTVKIDRRRRHVMLPGAMYHRLGASANEWDGIPRVSSVTHTPILRADGSLLGSPGYDWASRMLYLPDPDFSPLEIPEKVGPEWVKWAADTVRYLLSDFPFVESGHRANAIALLMTPLLRAVLPPPYPMFMLDAPQRGTGKTKIAKIASILHGGVTRPPLPADDDEVRKQITTVLTTTTAPFVYFDNVVNRVSSGELASLLTNPVWEDRVLGRNDKNVHAANDRVWSLTGNNIRIGGDMARRSRWISLDANTPTPEYRTGFHEPDLEGYARSNRGALVTALLVLALAWVQREMPIKELRSDDYARWEGGMFEILNGPGVELGEGFGGRETAVNVDLSEDEQELLVFVEAVSSVMGGEEWTVAKLKDRSTAALMSALPTRVASGQDPWRNLGHYLRRHEKQYAGNKRFVRVGDARTGAVWQIEQQ